MLIAYLTVGGAATLAGVVMVIIQLIQDLTPVVGSYLILAGLVQFSVGVWLYKRQGDLFMLEVTDRYLAKRFLEWLRQPRLIAQSQARLRCVMPILFQIEGNLKNSCEAHTCPLCNASRDISFGSKTISSAYLDKSLVIIRPSLSRDS